ncbi:glutathione S-transferase N-terminal domain-containing protein [Schlegelella sp. S2-27]|uniref:Glutathione S-transferase N-terminal domain-containing protein n=1 Tax=Caldimonas mangrovi TaxID=2944811 RepID=A0ABT0YLI9_9BURK|nr:glutathione S-transferase N-terminal domain-containing protein [Caldimonas mangrovi]MCM5679585.1 glutathione S-transferase N-terminal domain-containing protein [Caldimonas mangrovi]
MTPVSSARGPAATWTLYFAPGTCSLAPHILLREAGLHADLVEVDIASRRTAAGDNYTQVNPRGYVPALRCPDGRLLTENVAVCDWIAQQSPQLAPATAWERTSQLEWLAFASTELHKPFIRYFFTGSEAERSELDASLRERFVQVARRLAGEHLAGARYGAADALMYVMLRWARNAGLAVPDTLAAYRDRIEARAAVQAALQHEGQA